MIHSVGLYEPPATNGATIPTVVEDVLLRFDFSISKLSGQTYDGAANMAGQYNGCQALISEKQPLVLFVHCGAHSANLVMQQPILHARRSCETQSCGPRS